jgi:hypothetical protein
MKQTVVFTEGKRDLNLIRLFFYLYYGDVDVEHMVGEEIEHDRLHSQESDRLSSLFGDWSDTEVLIKSEGNKNNLIEVFTHVLSYVTREGARIVFLVDLDGGELNAVEDDIRERVEERFTDSPTVDRRGAHETDEVILSELALASDTDDDGVFYVIGFKHSMEISAGIDSEDDDECAETRKMYELLEEDGLWRSLDGPIYHGRLT